MNVSRTGLRKVDIRPNAVSNHQLGDFGGIRFRARREPRGTDRTEWQYSLTRKSMISVRRCCLKSPS
jgi:hypothetical protein